jgi:hypothetical protein
MSESANRNTLNTHGGSDIQVSRSKPSGMQCAELDELISAHADRQTTVAESEAIEAHMVLCARCKAKLRRHQRTLGLLRHSSVDSWSPPDLCLLIAHRIAEDRQPARRPHWAIGLAACLVIAILLGAFSLGTDSPWRSASSVAGFQPATVLTTSLTTPSAAACAHATGRVLARCLGISLSWLPTLLAEERPDHVAVAAVPKHEMSPPLQSERHSLTPAVTGILSKGGDIGSTTMKGRHGLIPM